MRKSSNNLLQVKELKKKCNRKAINTIIWMDLHDVLDGLLHDGRW